MGEEEAVGAAGDLGLGVDLAYGARGWVGWGGDGGEMGHVRLLSHRDYRDCGCAKITKFFPAAILIGRELRSSKTLLRIRVDRASHGISDGCKSLHMNE